MNHSHIFGIDLGGTNLRIRLCSPKGETLSEQRIKLAHPNEDHVLSCLCETILRMFREHELNGSVILSFAIAAMLDETGQMVLKAPNLGWKSFPLVQELQKRLQIPHKTLLHNDVDAAAFGEFTKGAGRGASHLACVFVGSGVGCGLVLNQKLHTGSAGVAGEFGHMKVVTKEGRFCGCEQRGCIEAYAGGHNLSQILQEAAVEDEGWLGQRAKEVGLGALTPADLELGLFAEDPTCLKMGKEAASFLGLGLANLVTLLNPSHLVLGGTVMRCSPLFRGFVLEATERFCNPPAWETVSIVESALGDDAGLTGAIELGLSLMV